jgi:hypothetical protein
MLLLWMLSFYATTYLWDYNINHVLIVVLLMLLRSDAIVVIMIKGFYAIWLMNVFHIIVKCINRFYLQ